MHSKCPYCGQDTIFTDSKIIYDKSYGMVYTCANYPFCDAYVGVHKGTKTALGRLANRELRELKKQAHLLFDELWKSKRMSRKHAYKWLSEQLKIPVQDTHIGYFDIGNTKKVINICQTKMLTDKLKTISIFEYEKIKPKLRSTDLCLFIVRKSGNVKDNRLIHVPNLSPSEALLNKYNNWKHRIEKAVWWVEYEKLFNEEMKQPVFVKNIERISQRLKEGRHVYLICYCQQNKYCHRSLVKQKVIELLKEEQNNV